MAKNKLLFSTPRGGVVLRPGTSKLLTGKHNHHDDCDHDHHHHHDHHGHHDHDRHGRRGIDVREFETIRVVADNRPISVSCVFLVLIITDKHGRFLGILDKIKLAPGQSCSRPYRVPGEFLEIKAIAAFRSRHKGRFWRRGVDVIDVAVFGHK